MYNISNNNTLIAKNTLMLYIRMLFNLIISFYTSRILLDNLGLTDFGISNVVGGVVTLFSFINNSMALSVQRFLAYEFGKKDMSGYRVNLIYSMSLLIHLFIAFSIVILTEIVGFFLLPELNIPVERLVASRWVFHISVITCAIGFMQIPAVALIMATEKMSIYAYISIVDVLLKLLIIFLLPYFSYDRLICYSFFLLFILLFVTSIYYWFCYKKISSVRIILRWNKGLFKEMLSFASWSLLGEIAWTAVGQGVNIVLNLFYSPIVNAARAIGLQISVKLKEFVANFQTALNPQIIKLYAADERQRMFKLSNSGTKFSFFLMLFISMPFFFEIDWILSFWLKEVPEWANIFCQLSIIGTLIDILSNLFSTMVKATGHIKKYQMIVSLILFLNLPLSYIFLFLGSNPAYVFIVYIFVSSILLIVRLLLVKSLLDFIIIDYVKEVLVPSLLTVIFSLPLPYMIHNIMPEQSFSRFIVVSFTCLLMTGIGIFIVGLNKDERSFVINKVINYVK